MEAPIAPRRPCVARYHDREFPDDYRWLRDKSDPAVIAYLEAENAYTAAVSAPWREFEARLYAEMLGRIQQTDLSVPVRRGAWLYYSRTEEGRQYPIHCRKPASGDGGEKVLLDCNQLAAGQPYFDLGLFEVSDDGRRLAYSTDLTGFRRYRLAVQDLETGELLAATLERVTSVAWGRDSHRLWCTQEDEITKRSFRLVWLDADANTPATPVYDETDELYSVGLDRTRDREYLLLECGATDSVEMRYWPAATLGPPRVLEPRARDHKYSLDHRNGLFYVVTNRDAKNFRVVTTPAAAPDLGAAREFLPHRPEVLIQSLDLFGRHAVVFEKEMGLNRFRVLDFEGGGWRGIALPEPVYALFPGANPEYDARHYRYHYQSLIVPASVYDYDLASGAAELRKRQPVLGGYEPAAYESQRLWATAPDGARVPVSLVARRDRPPGGPLLLYGYGAYGHAIPATFSSSRLSLLDRGLAFAIAHVRGGNELGEPWHDQGMLLQKPNTFTDFIACAEHLIAAGWTSPGGLLIQGGSAGGLLIAAVLNRRPDLFAAAHLAVPFVDVVNTMMDRSLPLTVGEYLEWGDPNQPAAFECMLSYSPYDNLAPRAYPPLLVTTSLNDSQVMYWEPAKYIARLRALNGGAPRALLKVNLAAGHAGASGRYDRLREVAFEFTWLLVQAGLA